MAVDTPWVDPQPAAGCDGGIKRIAASAALAADMQELVSMGFSSKQARDALEEASGDVEAAAEWLVANCM
jgi:Holliday junction resolvasome RuvABC DNA-binding subunit